MTDEEFYEATIAPALLDLARQCENRKMPFLAMVGYDDVGSVGRTATMPAGAPATIRYADAIGQAWCEGGNVNIDGFMFGVMREAQEKGHGSLILAQLGVPNSTTTPP
jgi:hypothetical protein